MKINVWTPSPYPGAGTNPVCPEYVEAFDYCGCERCGHTKDQHAWPRIVFHAGRVLVFRDGVTPSG